MAIEPKSFPLEGKVDGFLSEKQLTEHRDVLYKGYVTQYNNIQAALEKADVSKANPHFSEWGELKRRETWAHNGVVLHELYFELLGGGKVAPVGWAVWAWSFLDEKSHVYVVEQHQNHTPWLAIPLLILDEFEHAYYLDYATKRPDYLAKFWDNINWNAVEKRA